MAQTIAALMLCLFAITAFAAHPSDIHRTAWAKLTPEQQHALAPLAGEWDRLAPFRQRKWLKIAARYDKMPPEEQRRLQSRMSKWSQLTPAQRRLARKRFKKVQKLTPEERRKLDAQWHRHRHSAAAGKPPAAFTVRPAAPAATASPAATNPPH